jgi:cytoskeletal protein RodZ
MAMATSDTVGLGELLRRARESRGLTLEQISNETKIPYRHLKAIEHDNITAVPGDFYRRAEVRAYARAVQLDQSVALAELERASGPVAGGATTQKRKVSDPALFRKRALIAISVIVAAAALGRGTSQQGRALERAPQIRTATPAPPSEVPSPVASVPAAIAPASIEPAEVPGAADAKGDSTEINDPIEPREPADSLTELIVTTEPPGARVTVNGIGWGATPVTIRHLPAGEKRIRVTKEGYASDERVMRLTGGQPATVDIELQTP